MAFNDPQRKTLHGKPLWEVKMEMRALRQRFNLTDGQCNELLTQMQEIVTDSKADKSHRIKAFNSILGALKLDQTAAIEILRITGKQIDGVPEDELDSVIEGELADLASGPQTPSAGQDTGEEPTGETDADDSDDSPEGLS